MKVGPFYDGGCVDGYNMCGGTLDPAKYADFAGWVCNNIKAYQDQGVKIYGVSLQNEPWLAIWYVSAIYTNLQYRDMLKAVVPAIRQRFPDIKIYGAEMWLGAGGWDLPYLRDDPDAARCIDVLARHGYDGGGANANINASRKTYSDLYNMAQLGGRAREVWQTETSGFTETWVVEDGSCIFAMARDILNWLRYANASAWVWWKLEGAGGVNGAAEGLMSGSTGKKQYYALKQYARYLRPGAVRIASTVQDSANGVGAVAFWHRQKKTLSLVMINAATTTMPVTLSANGLPSSFKWYLTDQTRNCTAQNDIQPGTAVQLPPRSLSTFTAEGYDPSITVKACVAAPARAAPHTAPSSAWYDVTGRRVSGNPTTAGNVLVQSCPATGTARRVIIGKSHPTVGMEHIPMDRL